MASVYNPMIPPAKWKLEAPSHTGDGEKHDLLVGPFLGGIVVNGDATGSDITAVLCPWNIPITVVNMSLNLSINELVVLGAGTRGVDGSPMHLLT